MKARMSKWLLRVCFLRSSRGNTASSLTYAQHSGLRERVSFDTDKDGLTAPLSSNQIHCSVVGPAELIDTDNGDATSLVSFQSVDRAAFQGLALAILRMKPDEAGEIVVSATSDGLVPVKMSVSSRR